MIKCQSVPREHKKKKSNRKMTTIWRDTVTEFVEREEIIAKETGDLRQLSVPGECPFRTLRGDLVIVREQFTDIPVTVSWAKAHTLYCTCSPEDWHSWYRWLHKDPHRLTAVFHSVLEPKKMKQRKKKNMFFLTVSRQFIHRSI